MWHNYQSVTGQTFLSNNSAPNDESQLKAAPKVRKWFYGGQTTSLSLASPREECKFYQPWDRTVTGHPPPKSLCQCPFLPDAHTHWSWEENNGWESQKPPICQVPGMAVPARGCRFTVFTIHQAGRASS